MMPKFHPDHAVEIVAPKYGSAYRIGVIVQGDKI